MKFFPVGFALTRSVFFTVLSAGWVLSGVSTVSAQEATTPQVVALDRSSADLLRACFPAIELQVLIQIEDEPFESINARAWSIQDAELVVFRSDRLTITSQLFRQRLLAQGLPFVDLAAYVSVNRNQRTRSQSTDPESMPPRQKRSLATVMAIDQLDQGGQALIGARP